jgi:serine/threonine protein kinase
MENFVQKKFIINYDERIGKGGFGVVYVATDINERKPKKTLYAAKQINMEKEDVNALANEIIINTQFQNENLVEFFGINEIDNKYFLIFEYCNGGDLIKNFNEYFNRYGKPFTEEIVQKILKDILNGLSCLHRHQIIHHDIKFANILVSFKNEEDKNKLNLLNATFKITDFGLSKCKKDEETKTGNIGGTLSFMPPCILVDQLVHDENVVENDAIDMWAVGILAFKLVLNKHPFLTKEEEILDQFGKRKALYFNMKKGKYYIDLNDGTIEEISKEFLMFIDGIFKKNFKTRMSSEDCEYSRFITRKYSKFHLIDISNYKQELSSDFIEENGRLVFNINNESRLKEYKEFVSIS